MTGAHHDPDGPPAWLAGLLGEDDIVESPAPISTVRHAAIGVPSTADGAPAESTPKPEVPSSAVYFAVVDRYDPNRVLSFHALTASPVGDAAPTWWSFVGDDWLEDAEQAHDDRGRLRWVHESKAQLVVHQFRVVHRRRSTQPAAPAPEALESRLRRALGELSTGHVEIGPAYLQWAGYPEGLLVEVGNSESDGGPLDAPWAEHLAWLGWQAPDAEHINAWFRAENPHAVAQALDLIVRTSEVIRDALAAARTSEIPELTAEDIGYADRPEQRPIERVARDLPELLEVLCVETVQALEDALWDEFDDPDAALDLTGGEVFVVAHRQWGVGVEFPITASGFWELVREHYAEAEEMLDL